jgi:hypothetical protein
MKSIVDVLAAVVANTGEESFSGMENILHIVIGAFSILLVVLSITAYRKSGLRRIVYAALAFALFAINSFLELLGDIKATDVVYSNIIFPILTLFTLLLFFIAIVKRN